MKLGFIGTGKIASSIIFGIFKSSLKINKIYISSRNRNIAKKLSVKFKKVKTLKNNQDIINLSSVVLLSVTPSVGKKILKDLKFDKKKTIISLISTIKLNDLKKSTGVKKVCKAIPLPFVENRLGPIILSPKNKIAKISFSFWSTSSIMAAYYELLNSTTKWLIKKKIKPKTATKYSSELFLSLSKDAVLKKEIGFNKLVADSQTPGGLNMQVLKELKKGKFYDKFLKSLDNVHRRIKH